MFDLALRCRCGAVRGVVRAVAPSRGTRVVCYCDDCRAYARHLGRDDLLDAHGGSDIFQIAPSQVTLTAGADQLACLRLSPQGMFRWYSKCCRTPLGNTLSARVPFVGLSPALVAEALTSQGLAIDAALGPAVGVQGRFAAPSPAPGAHRTMPPGLLLRVMKNLAVWWLRGRGHPSPYFGRDGRPAVEAEVLSAERRASLRARDGAPSTG